MYSTHVGLEHAIGNRRGRCVQWVGNMDRYPLRKLLGVRKKMSGLLDMWRKTMHTDQMWF